MLISIANNFWPNKINNFTWRLYLTESSIEIEGALAWGYLDQDQWSKITSTSQDHVSYLRSLIMIQITPKERTQNVIIIDFRNSKQEDNSKITEFNVQGSSWLYRMTLNTRIFEVFLLWTLYQQWHVNINIVIHELRKPG